MKKTKKKKSQKIKAESLPGSTVKLSFKKHLVPPLSGLFVMFLVLALFNSQIIASKIYNLTYRAPAASVIVSESSPVDPAAKTVTIEDIGVQAPIVFGQKSINEANFQIALRDGVVHYPQTAMPGQPGNVVIFGHSSGQVWAPGNYKFVFMHLEKLNIGQRIIIENEGQRYIYKVSGKKVVPPTDVSVLAQDPSKHILTLITCTPVGTSKNRLIITADQVAPPPAQNNVAENKQPVTEIQELPGTVNPGFWQSVRNWFN